MTYNNENSKSDRRSEAGRDGKSNYKRDARGSSDKREYRNSERNSSTREDRGSKSGYGKREGNYQDREKRDSRRDFMNRDRRDNKDSNKNNYDNREKRDTRRSSSNRDNRFGNNREIRGYNNRNTSSFSRSSRETSGGDRDFQNPRNSYHSNRSSGNNYDETRYRDENKGEKLKFRSKKETESSDNVKNREGKRNRKRITVKKSYDPNAKYSQKKQFAHKQSYVDPNKPIRLNKYLANAGVCSRREADEYIQAGVVSVNDEIVNELGTKVLISDRIKFHNQPVSLERKVYLLLNKPKDCVTTTDDPQDRHTVMDIVKNACSERIYPVGRLDRNTTGVLLLTNDGELASRLTHPKFEKRKIYQVGLDKELSDEDFNTILNEGVDLGDFTIKADDLSFIKGDNKKNVGIEIHSGQNRVIRRLFEKLGYKVYKLDRVYYAGLTKKNVPRGKYRFLNEKEINFLKMNSGG